MKKLFIILGCFLPFIWIFSCQKTTANINLFALDVYVPDAMFETKNIVAQEDWQFTLLGSDWKSIPIIEKGIKVLFHNKTKNISVIMLKEPSKLSLADYVGAALKSFIQPNMSIISNELTMIEKQLYQQVEIANGEQRIQIWLTRHDDFGYAFICGGSADQEKFCAEMVETLIIK